MSLIFLQFEEPRAQGILCFWSRAHIMKAPQGFEQLSSKIIMVVENDRISLEYDRQDYVINIYIYVYVYIYIYVYIQMYYVSYLY